MERTRVFVVEDNLPVLKGLLRSLAAFPELEIVGSAQDGEAALREIPSARPHLALLDLELPGMNGIEVTRRLRTKAPEIEVLILTTFDDEQKVYEAIQAGASGYLVKRVGPQKIRDGIHEVLDGGTVIEPIIARRFWNYFQAVKARPPEPADPWGLSPLEREVLGYVAKGLSNAEIAGALTLERRTVRTHLSHIYKKMGVHSHVDAVVLALRAGLVEL